MSTSPERSLPARPFLGNLRKQARTLQRQHRAAAPDALQRVAALLSSAERPLKLHDAQFVIAREYGFPSWPKLVAHVEEPPSERRVQLHGERVWIDAVPRLRWGASPEPTYVGALEAAFRGSDQPLDVTTLLGDSVGRRPRARGHLSEAQRSNLFFLSSWTFSSLHQTRTRHAAPYLRAQAHHLPSAAAPEIAAAAQCYEQVRQRLGTWDPATPLFGYVKQKKLETWTPEVRADEITLLRDVGRAGSASHGAHRSGAAHPQLSRRRGTAAALGRRGPLS